MIKRLLTGEETERAIRSLGGTHIDRFKPIADFDWNLQKHWDRTAISELLTLEFLNTAANVSLVGASGLGKSTNTQNIAHQAVLHGHTVLLTTAGQPFVFGYLAAIDSDSVLRRRLRYYAAPDLLVFDEAGYLSYSNRHADLLFELINRRHEQKSTLVTIKPRLSTKNKSLNRLFFVGQNTWSFSVIYTLHFSAHLRQH